MISIGDISGIRLLPYAILDIVFLSAILDECCLCSLQTFLNVISCLTDFYKSGLGVLCAFIQIIGLLTNLYEFILCTAATLLYIVVLLALLHESGLLYDTLLNVIGLLTYLEEA